MERRTFLRLGLGGAALVATQPMFRRDPASAQPAPGPFGHGVASGDPLPDRVILWTRVTPSADATPGSGLGTATEVAWQVAEDTAFSRVVASGQVVTDAARDHSVRVDASGLAPSTTYWYRFAALGATSPVGRTRTAPAAGADVERLRFGVVSCSNWEGGYFSAYRHVADRDDLDCVLHLGDYVYEYGAGGYGPGAAIGRVHDPANEMVTLEDYRRRHALYKTDPDLQRLHARYALIATIDDHEVTDNSWADGAVNHQPADGDYHQRRASAFQAYFEWMPIRTTGGDDGEPTRLWRRLPFGALADLFMLDERTYRSRQPEGVSGDLLVTSPERDDPDRTMLGDEQRTFLVDGLRDSEARWKLLGNGVMFAPLVLADLPDGVAELLAPLGLPAGLPLVLNGDQWDGYRAEQRALSTVFGEVGGVVVLTGDIHSSWAAEVPDDPSTYLPGVGGAATAVEFVTPAVTSDSFTAAIEGAGLPNAQQLSGLLPAAIVTAAPWFKYLDPDRHGFGVLEVAPTHVQYDWYHISDRTDPEATAAFTTGYRTLAGTNRLDIAPQLSGGSGGSGPATTAPPTTAPSTTAPPPADPGAGAPSLPATGDGTDGTRVAIAAGATVAAVALADARRRARVGQDDEP